MCNAKNHHPQCRCGFGPPYAFWGVMKFEEKKSWVDSILAGLKTLSHGLEELGYEPEEIEEILEGMDKGRLKKKDAQKIKDQVLNQYSYSVEGAITQGVAVPIFMLHLPEYSVGRKVKGSRIIFKENGSKEGNWELRAIGSGMGSSRIIKINSSAFAVAEREQCKILYINIPVKATKIVVTENNQKVRQFLKVELVGEPGTFSFYHGLKTCKKKKCREDYRAMGVPIAFFPLADTEPRTIIHYNEEWDYGSKREIRIQLKAFGLSAIMKVEIYRKNKLKLEMDLPGGHDYLLLAPKKKGGITWELDDAAARGILDSLNVNGSRQPPD